MAGSFKPLDEAGEHAGRPSGRLATAPAEHSAHEMMGHGGHSGMSMDDMVRDMRNRFLVAVAFAIPIATLVWVSLVLGLFGRLLHSGC